MEHSKTSVFAILSLIVAILSLFVAWIPLMGLFPALLAIILGIVGIVVVQKNKGTLDGKGLAIAGVVIGGISLIIALVAIIITGVFIVAVGETINEMEQMEIEENTVIEVTETGETVEKVISDEEKRLKASDTAQEIARLWEKGDWSAIYEYLPTDEKDSLSKKEFVFFMGVTSYDTRAQYDDEFQDYIYNNFLYAVDNSKKTEVTVTGVDSWFENDATMSTEVSYKGVPVEYWNSYSLVWEEGAWKLEAIDYFFEGTNAKVICPGLNYPDECFRDYALEFKEISYCDKAGGLMAGCYRELGEIPSPDAVLAACSSLETKQNHDECVLEAITTNGEDLCSEMKLSQNSYICFGQVAGYNENLNECLDRITDTGTTEKIRISQCVEGYVTITKDTSVCSRIDNSLGEAKEDCYKIK
ncbi:hypothetical protein GOV10_01480 [Candidatus Woesearchaeota archaeon]|nr:hypothetical protein [Candidatus Woesearchaeota archaeon]